jgi:Flp pilus assembly protein TadG
MRKSERKSFVSSGLCASSSSGVRFCKSERGVAAVEFALLLPVLVLLLFGIIEFGLLLYDQQLITNASREGARAGIVQAPRLTEAQIKQVVNDYLMKDSTPGNWRLITFASSAVAPNPTVEQPPAKDCSGGFGTTLEVKVTYQYTFLVLRGLGFAGPLLSAKTIMKCE